MSLREIVDAWFYLWGLWTPPALLPAMRHAHQHARQSVGHPTHRRR